MIILSWIRAGLWRTILAIAKWSISHPNCFFTIGKNISVINMDFSRTITKEYLQDVLHEQEFGLTTICGIIQEPLIRDLVVNICVRPFFLNGKWWCEGGVADITKKTIYSFPYEGIVEGYGQEFIGHHELAHIIVGYYWGNCKNMFFVEGLANALDGTFQRRKISQIYNKIRSSGSTHDFDSLLCKSGQIPHIQFYPESGMAVQWLINKFGLAIVKKLYQLGSERPYPKIKMESITSYSYRSICDAFNEEVILGEL
jgi:hypothetical protein